MYIGKIKTGGFVRVNFYRGMKRVDIVKEFSNLNPPPFYCDLVLAPECATRFQSRCDFKEYFPVRTRRLFNLAIVYVKY